jgi:hypothetical protein
MTWQEKSFLVNYLGDREKKWGIHDDVKGRFYPFDKNVKEIISEGYIIDTPEKYALTDSGKTVSKDFKKTERDRRNAAHRKIMSLAMERDYLGAYNARAEYERNSVIPHGISISFGSSLTSPGSSSFQNSIYEHWKEEKEIPSHVLCYIRNSEAIDFSDCNNSEAFKSDLRAFYVGAQISGSSDISLPDDFETYRGEYLNCPSLEKQLKEKCLFKKIPRLSIYYNTKVRVFNFISTGLIDSWDGNFQLGTYDCTDPYHFEMAEFEIYSELGITSFPKTFRTYFKHKKDNSEKYQAWMAEVGDRRLEPIKACPNS